MDDIDHFASNTEIFHIMFGRIRYGDESRIFIHHGHGSIFECCADKGEWFRQEFVKYFLMDVMEEEDVEIVEVKQHTGGWLEDDDIED